jgi:hypothetical protein
MLTASASLLGISADRVFVQINASSGIAVVSIVTFSDSRMRASRLPPLELSFRVAGFVSVAVATAQRILARCGIVPTMVSVSYGTRVLARTNVYANGSMDCLASQHDVRELIMKGLRI